MRRNHFLCAGLFVAIYCGSLAYFWLTDPHRSSLAATLEGDRSTLEVSQQPVQRSMPAAIGSGGAPQHAASPNTATIAAASAGATHIAETALERQQPTQHLDLGGRRNDSTGQFVAASDPSERTNELGGIANVARSSQDAASLYAVATGDPIASNRLTAVKGLRNLANHGYADGTVKSALNQALFDRDPRVAKLARYTLEYEVERNPPLR